MATEEYISERLGFTFPEAVRVPVNAHFKLKRDGSGKLQLDYDIYATETSDFPLERDWKRFSIEKEDMDLVIAFIKTLNKTVIPPP